MKYSLLVLVISVISIIGVGVFLANGVPKEIEIQDNVEMITVDDMKFSMKTDEKKIINSDTILFETSDKKHWLNMESSIDANKLLITDEIEVTKKTDKWKFNYKFNANNDNYYKVRLTSDEPFIIGNWSVWTNHITYDFMDAIESGYVTKVQADGNAVVVSFDIKGKTGMVEIDPFILISESGRKVEPTFCVYDSKMYVIGRNYTSPYNMFISDSSDNFGLSNLKKPGGSNLIRCPNIQIYSSNTFHTFFRFSRLEESCNFFISEPILCRMPSKQ